MATFSAQDCNLPPNEQDCNLKEAAQGCYWKFRLRFVLGYKLLLLLVNAVISTFSPKP